MAFVPSLIDLIRGGVGKVGHSSINVTDVKSNSHKDELASIPMKQYDQ